VRATSKNAAMQDTARQRILSVAARLYAMRGYQGTSMREIAEGAGVTKPLVYYHFGSKEHLFSTLLRQAIAGCRCAAECVVERDAGAAERLRDLLHCHCELARQAPEVVAFAHEVLSMPGLLPLGFDYRAEGRELFELYVRVVEEGVRCGEFRQVDARAVAVLAIAAVGMYVEAVLAGDLDGVPADLDNTLVELLLRGVEVRS